MPREKPILFSAPMVRAILAGTKTVTRRIITPQQPKPSMMTPYELEMTERDGSITAYTKAQFIDRLSPFRPRQHLWVKETWRSVKSLDSSSPSGMAEACIDAGYSKPWAPIRYEADHTDNGNVHAFMSDAKGWGKTRVSIHMPRWASRITLEVVDVRVERLSAIDEADAQREGVEPFRHPSGQLVSYRDGFARLWDEINGDRIPFDENPWVWRVEFKRVADEKAKAA